MYIYHFVLLLRSKILQNDSRSSATISNPVEATDGELVFQLNDTLNQLNSVLDQLVDALEQRTHKW